MPHYKHTLSQTHLQQHPPTTLTSYSIYDNVICYPNYEINCQLTYHNHNHLQQLTFPPPQNLQIKEFRSDTYNSKANCKQRTTTYLLKLSTITAPLLPVTSFTPLLQVLYSFPFGISHGWRKYRVSGTGWRERKGLCFVSRPSFPPSFPPFPALYAPS